MVSVGDAMLLSRLFVLHAPDTLPPSTSHPDLFTLWPLCLHKLLIGTPRVSNLSLPLHALG